MTARGIGLVARQEIRTRLRTGRWKTLLAVWFVIVNGLGVLLRLAIEADASAGPGGPGVPMFGGVLLGVLARSITSVLMSYLTLFGLLVGPPLLFVIADTLTTQETDVYMGPGETTTHTDEFWWLLAPNPVVVLADAAPRLPERRYIAGDAVYTRSPSSDPLGEISREVRKVRVGDGYERSDEDRASAVWPYGLAFDLALAAGAVWVTSARLRTPLHRVPKGVRVA